MDHPGLRRDLDRLVEAMEGASRLGAGRRHLPRVPVAGQLVGVADAVADPRRRHRRGRHEEAGQGLRDRPRARREVRRGRGRRQPALGLHGVDEKLPAAGRAHRLAQAQVHVAPLGQPDVRRVGLGDRRLPQRPGPTCTRCTSRTCTCGRRTASTGRTRTRTTGPSERATSTTRRYCARCATRGQTRCSPSTGTSSRRAAPTRTPCASTSRT